MPTYTMRVFRGDPGGGEFKDYRVETGEGMVVLDVIHRIQATQAPDLACRWNCKAGKCGSCSAEVNGKPRLMCMTRMNLFEEGATISVAPVRTFPIIRDLVTDVSYNYEKAKQIPPPRSLSTTLTVPHVSSLYGWSSRVCPPRLSVRSSAAIAQHAATVSSDLTSSAVCQPGL